MQCVIHTVLGRLDVSVLSCYVHVLQSGGGGGVESRGASVSIHTCGVEDPHMCALYGSGRQLTWEAACETVRQVVTVQAMEAGSGVELPLGVKHRGQCTVVMCCYACYSAGHACRVQQKCCAAHSVSFGVWLSLQGV
jgi:hypothetical protein